MCKRDLESKRDLERAEVAESILKHYKLGEVQAKDDLEIHEVNKSKRGRFSIKIPPFLQQVKNFASILFHPRL